MIWYCIGSICLSLTILCLIIVRHLLKFEDKYREGYAYPKVGDLIPFYDDDKTGGSRRYIAEVVDIIPFAKAPASVIKRWRNEVNECDWLYDKYTSHFIVIRVPQYDDNLLYCAQDQEDGWFSFDNEKWWQSGRLDVDGRTSTILYQYSLDMYAEYGHKIEIKFNSELPQPLIDKLLKDAFIKRVASSPSITDVCD